MNNNYKLTILNLMLGITFNSFSADTRDITDVEVVRSNLDPAAQYANYSNSRLKRLALKTYLKTGKVDPAALKACQDRCGGGTEEELIRHLGYHPSN